MLRATSYSSNPSPRILSVAYEVAICLSKEDKWAQHVLFKLSQATVEETFDVGHTADITAWVDPDCVIKGLLFTKLISFEFGGQSFGALHGIGVARLGGC